MVMTSATWPPRWAVKLVDAGLSEKSGGGPAAVLKVAVTKSSEVIVRLHVPVPVQFVLQPENSELAAGEAVRLTAVPAPKLAVHDVPQFTPAGLLVTVPLPLPANSNDRT